MAKTILYNALLFNKELGPRPYRYRLYFCVQNPGEEPEIHRFYTNSYKAFQSMTPGGIYDLEYSGIRIKEYEFIEVQQLSDATYYHLIDLRDLQFMDNKNAKRFGILQEDYDPSDHYYSYGTYKSLVEYDPGFAGKLCVYLLKMVGYVLSMFIPIFLYIFFLYSVTLLHGGDASSLIHAIAVPLGATLALPMVFWMIHVLHSLSDTCLLMIQPIRTYMLKTYALRWAGMKKNISVSREQRKDFAISGSICFALLIASIVILLFV